MAFTIKKHDTVGSVIYYLNFLFNKQSIKVGIEVVNDTPHLAYPYYTSLKVLNQDPTTNNIKLIGFISCGIFDKDAIDLLADKGFLFEVLQSEGDFYLKKEAGFSMEDIECVAKIIESRLAKKEIFSP